MSKTNKMIIFIYIWCTIAYCTLAHILDFGMLSARPIIAKMRMAISNYSFSQNIVPKTTHLSNYLFAICNSYETNEYFLTKTVNCKCMFNLLRNAHFIYSTNVCWWNVFICRNLSMSRLKSICALQYTFNSIQYWVLMVGCWPLISVV